MHAYVNSYIFIVGIYNDKGNFWLYMAESRLYFNVALVCNLQLEPNLERFWPSKLDDCKKLRKKLRAFIFCT